MFNNLNISFREKSAWITLAVLLFVYTPYFARVVRLADRDQLSIPNVIGLFVSALVLQILLAIVAHIVISIGARRETKDERDRAIEAKAFRNGYFIFSFLICTAAIGMLTLGLAPGSAALPWISVAGISQALLLCLVLAEVTKYATHIICYRRGV